MKRFYVVGDLITSEHALNMAMDSVYCIVTLLCQIPSNPHLLQGDYIIEMLEFISQIATSPTIAHTGVGGVSN